MLFTLINPISGRRGEERRGEERNRRYTLVSWYSSVPVLLEARVRRRLCNQKENVVTVWVYLKIYHRIIINHTLRFSNIYN
jgi:hypothetical protein